MKQKLLQLGTSEKQDPVVVKGNHSCLGATRNTEYKLLGEHCLTVLCRNYN